MVKHFLILLFLVDASLALAADQPPARLAAESKPDLHPPDLHSPDLHHEVQFALAYQLPKNTCELPKSKAYRQETGQEAKKKRKLKRYRRCVVSYKKKILDDYNRLHASAQYGLTENQARTILKQMAAIQKAIESPYGLVVDPVKDEKKDSLINSRPIQIPSDPQTHH